MQTTKDAVLNAKTVFGYDLPPAFNDVVDAESKSMIELGNFYNLATRILNDFEAGQFPMPKESNAMDIFQADISESSEKSEPSEFAQDYQAYMKTLSKEMGVKGKNLFHPVRLALTGEMSGQEITKQLSILVLASSDDSCIDAGKAGVVSINERMERLKAFCDSIPEEFRSPKVVEKKADKKADKGSKSEVTEISASTATQVAQKDPKDEYEGPPITALDIRVGRITKVWEHPEADKLYCEEIDVGEDEPRNVASGLKPFMKAEDMEGKLVLVLCNLKARKMVGFPSHGMVLCASNSDHTDVRLVNPPVDAKVGERITIPDFDFEGEDAQPFAENKVGKKKIFEKIAPHLVTSKYGVPEFLGRPFMTSAGVCTSAVSQGTVA